MGLIIINFQVTGQTGVIRVKREIISSTFVGLAKVKLSHFHFEIKKNVQILNEAVRHKTLPTPPSQAAVQVYEDTIMRLHVTGWAPNIEGGNSKACYNIT